MKKISTQPASDFRWQSIALNFFYKIFGWIALPIVVALFIADKLNTKYNTTNKYTFICVSIAFLISVTGFVVEGLKAHKMILSLSDDLKVKAVDKKPKKIIKNKKVKKVTRKNERRKLKQ